MLESLIAGAVGFGASYIGGRKRLERQKEAQASYDASMANYFNQDTSNLYSGMENAYEDLTINQQQAQFTAQQQAQGFANTMQGLRGAAGGSGIAALAQSLASQQSTAAQQASASIGQQEAANQRLAAGEASRLQLYERKGAEQSRELQAQLLGERAMLDAGELQKAEEEIQAAKEARAKAAGQLMGGVAGLGGSFVAGYAKGGYDQGVEAFKNNL